MKKLLVLIVFLFCVISAISLHRSSAQECPNMNAYMVNTSGECVSLDYLHSSNSSDEDLSVQNVSDLMPAADNAPSFPPQQDINTLVVDNNNAFLRAVRRLKAGDRLLVKDGTYQAREGEQIVVDAQGTSDNWIVIAAYPGHKPLLKGTAGTTVNMKGAAYVEIQGFEVIGADARQNSSGIGILVENRSHHIQVIKNVIHDTPGGAIEVLDSDYLHVEGNTIYNVAWGWIHSEPNYSNAESAISFYQLTDADQSELGIRNIVRSNVVFNTYNTQPFVYGDSITDGNCFILDDTQHTQEWGTAVREGATNPYTGTTLVENNLCVDNGGRGIHVYLSDNLIARNNTLYKNGKTPGIEGELSAVESRNIRFYNNILYSKFGSKAIVNYDSNNVEMENNLVFGTNKIDKGSETLIKGDPLFVNPTTDLKTANFLLRNGSPAIGTGLPENCADTYFDGSPRTGSCDLGAFPVAR